MTNLKLITPIRFWYDEEQYKKSTRRRVNGISIMHDPCGNLYLVVARATCSRRDQFVKAKGRLIVEQRMLGQAKKHCYTIHLDTTLFICSTAKSYAQLAVDAYKHFWPNDERGIKRAYNVGNNLSRELSLYVHHNLVDKK